VYTFNFLLSSFVITSPVDNVLFVFTERDLPLWKGGVGTPLQITMDNGI
jgi:hypothetical protein